uniref:Uncharacterized protein n=1 Tax=Pararge aegeria TaxID=116150 RepID=S4PCR7_9NEOP
MSAQFLEVCINRNIQRWCMYDRDPNILIISLFHYLDVLRNVNETGFSFVSKQISINMKNICLYLTKKKYVAL